MKILNLRNLNYSEIYLIFILYALPIFIVIAPINGAIAQDQTRLAQSTHKFFTEQELIEIANSYFQNAKLGRVEKPIVSKVPLEECGFYYGSIIRAAIEDPDISAPTKQALLNIIENSMPTLERTYNSTNDPSLAHFFIRYTLQGGTLHNPDGLVNPTDSDGDGHPDYIETIAVQLENSYSVEINSFNFTAPNDPVIEVRVYNKGYLPLWGGVAGEAYKEGGEIIIDIDNNLIESNTTVSHELFHTIQMTIDPRWFAPWIDEEWWIIEGTARWMEDAVYDERNSYIWNGNNYFLENTNSSLNVNENRYASCLYWKFFGEHYGTDGDNNPAYLEYNEANKVGADDNGVDVILELWNACQNANGINAVNTVLRNHGSFFELSFTSWLETNYMKDLGNPFAQGYNDYLEDENGYVHIADGHLTYSWPVPSNGDPVQQTYSGSVNAWAADYFSLDLNDQIGQIIIEFDGDDDIWLIRPNRFSNLNIVCLRDTDGDGFFDSAPLGYIDYAMDGNNNFGVIIQNEDYDQILIIVPGAENGGDYELNISTSTETDNPTVVSHREGTSIGTNIYVTFSEHMDETTFTNSTISVSGSSSGTHSCSFSFDHNSYELTINPSSNFSYSEIVTITIGTGVKDFAGNSLASPYEINFQIQSESQQPSYITIIDMSLNPPTVDPFDQFEVSGYAQYNTGDPVEVGTAEISISGENILYTTPVVNGSFSRNIQAPDNSYTYNINKTVTVTVKDGLVQEDSESSTLVVRGMQPENGYEFYRATTCVDVVNQAPYTPIEEKPVFSMNDPKCNVWVHLKNLYKPVRVKWEWYKPDDSHYATRYSNWTDDPQDYDYLYWYDWWFYCYFEISGYDISNEEGLWRCEVFVMPEGGSYEHVETAHFTVRYEFAEHRMCKNVESSEPYDPINPTNLFLTDDTRAYTWAKFINVADPLELKWIYYSPEGQYSEFTYTTDDPQDKGYDWYGFMNAWGWIGINGNSAQYKCGDWHVDVFVKDAFGNWEQHPKYTDNFRIEEHTPPVISVSAIPESPIEQQNITLNVTASDNNHLQKVLLHWNNDSHPWDNIDSSQLQDGHAIGSNFDAGQVIQYWAEAWDESGNRTESEHRSIIIQQAIPILSVTPDNRIMEYTTGTNTFNVSNTGNGTMNWDASVTQGSDWLSINSGGNGIDSGVIQFSVTENPDYSQRTGAITITASGATKSPKTVYVIQSPNDQVIVIDGIVTYCDNPNIVIPNVLLAFSGGSSENTTTNESGYFTKILPVNTWTVTPSKDYNLTGTILTGFDASLAARKAANLIALTPYQEMLADADENGIIQGYDAALIARSAAGFTSTIGKCKTWVFSPEDYPDISATSTLNFAAGIKGDVDESGKDEPITEKTKGTLEEGTFRYYYTSIDEFVIELTNLEPEPVYGINFELRYRVDNIEFLEILKEGEFELITRNEPENVSVVMFAVSPMQTNVNLLKVKFRKSTTDPGQITIDNIYFNNVYKGSIVMEPEEAIAKEFELYQNYPNPFNSGTKVAYQIQSSELKKVSLIIFDITGFQVKVLVDDYQSSGHYEVLWDGTNKQNIRVSSGMYLYKLQVGVHGKIKKMLFIK